jgi:hypothetical protein
VAMESDGVRGALAGPGVASGYLFVRGNFPQVAVVLRALTWGLLALNSYIGRVPSFDAVYLRLPHSDAIPV